MNPDNNKEQDFTGALLEEFGVPPKDDTTQTSPPTAASSQTDDGKAEQPPKAGTEGQVTPTDDKKPEDGEPENPQGGDKKEAQVADNDDKANEKVETEVEKATREAKEAADAAAAEAPKYATKDDVADALREYQSETQARVSKVTEAKEQIISKLHPEGIDQNVYDDNGNLIKTAQEIVDRGLINPDTRDPFTYEEAASFMLQAQQKAAQNIKELNDWAEGIAETNISLMEGNARVMAKWGETLKTLPEETVKQLAETYITKQVKFDEGNNYVVEVAMNPEEFYDMVMAPYTKLNEAIASKNQLEQSLQEQDQKAEQDERTGSIPPQRGTSETKSNTGDPMLDALVDELNKK